LKYKIIYKNGRFMPLKWSFLTWVGFNNLWPRSESEVGAPVDFETKKEAVDFITEYHQKPQIEFQ